MPDIATLCSPITPQQPAGEDMALSLEFDAILEARRADDPSLPQGEWITELKTADWPRVAALCSELLAGRTKDIRVCAWLTEAWGHERGFMGLADGFRLLAALCREAWPHLHPLPADDEDDIRISSIEKMRELCAAVMHHSPLATDAARQWSLSDFEAARRVAQQPAHGDDAGESADNELNDFAAALKSMPADHIASVSAGLDALESAVDELEAAVTDRLGNGAPAFNVIRELADSIRALLSRHASSESAAAGRPDKRPPAKASSPESTGGIIAGELNSRTAALEQLRAVARFFRSTEPHSPVAYLAEKAADWGEMPLHDWLRQVMHDEGELAHLEELLGTHARGRNIAAE